MKIEAKQAWVSQVFIDLWIDYAGQSYYWQAILETQELKTWQINAQEDDALESSDPLYCLIDTYAREYLEKDKNKNLNQLLNEIDYVS